MHLIFLVNEIFKIICECLTKIPRGPAALIALAQTCRSLNEISLDVLWAMGPINFDRVLKILPPDAWSFVDFPFSLNRPISSSELARLKKYTTRVTNLQVCCGPDLETFKTLINPHESYDWLALWPKVRVLNWWTECSDTLPFLRHFLTTDVRKLTINLEFSEDEEFQEALCIVESRCMNLVELRLFDSESRENKEHQDTIRQIIYNNSLTLKMFRPPQDPSPPLVNDILQLLPLQELEMHVPQIPESIPPEILPSLGSLTFTLDEPTDILGLLGTFRNSKLQFFRFTSPYPTTKEECSTLAGFFGDSGLYRSLRVFSWLPPDGFAPTWRFIWILRTFEGLQCLQLGAQCNSVCSFGFGHEEVIQISKWMPRLRELNLGGQPCARGGLQTTVGYHTLAVLIGNCPNLSLLTIHFNTGRFMPQTLYLAPNPRVVMWDVGETQLSERPEDLTMFALVVSKLFPRVTFVGDPPPEWNTVGEEIGMLTLPPIHRLLDLTV